ncbi:MAG TPA: vitamin K epoxide reductase family protein [Micromonosporaceae bacterium]|nr:vitamin K epoxide reductase family protein [Micromonosporaceae bacterium]
MAEAVRGRAARAPAGRAVPAWVPAVTLVLAVAGLAVSIYLTYEHFTGSTTLACSDNGVINCLKVTTSAQSKVLGIPVAVLGLVYFVAMIPLCLPVAWRDPRPLVARARLVASVVGVGFVLYLLYAELFEIGNICLWCTVVHVITVALFGVIVFAGALSDPDDV